MHISGIADIVVGRLGSFEANNTWPATAEVSMVVRSEQLMVNE